MERCTENGLLNFTSSLFLSFNKCFKDIFRPAHRRSVFHRMCLYLVILFTEMALTESGVCVTHQKFLLRFRLTNVVEIFFSSKCGRDHRDLDFSNVVGCGRNVVGMWSKCGRDRRDLDFSKRGLCVSESHTSKALAYDTSCGDHMSQGTCPCATADFSRLFFFLHGLVYRQTKVRISICKHF